MFDKSYQVVIQENVCHGIFRIILKAPEIALQSEPGQFVQLRIRDSIDPLLRRPFSIHQADRTGGIIEILYRVVGRGTRLMSLMKAGDTFDLIGPLGNPFHMPQIKETALIAVGGMGIAPVPLLIDRLMERKITVNLFWGARTSADFFSVPAFSNENLSIHYATEDGSRGYHGKITGLLKKESRLIKNGNIRMAYVCGPGAMIRGIQEIASDTDFSWEASLEEKMACGIGACMGCAVKMEEGDYRMVCTDGPVFDLKGIRF